jgi:N-acetylglucosaminyldiphosphoundecaprenol N-acetyl-beta-D-mannosaminyltransferase
MTYPTENIVGYGVATPGVQGCVDDIVAWVTQDPGAQRSKRCRWLACINPHSYVVASEDASFSRALKASDWLIPDGIGVVLASRMLRGRIRQRVSGSDIFHGVMSRLNRTPNRSVFFLGSTDETLEAIRARCAVDFPYVRVAGTYSPPFKPEYSEAELNVMIAAINSAEPDVLWIGMTAPKQEKWIYQNLDRLEVRFAGAVGAVFDFYIGRIKRAPVLFQKMGLEWLVRSVQEPRRLWRRHYVSAPKFVWHVLRAARRGGHNMEC